MATLGVQYVLVKMSGNYADEFDVEGFVVVSKDYFEKAKQDILALDDSEGLHLSFGTNESLTWSSAQELIGELDVTELTLAEAGTYEDHFECFSKTHDFIAEFGLGNFLTQIHPGNGN